MAARKINCAIILSFKASASSIAAATVVEFSPIFKQRVGLEEHNTDNKEL